MKQKFLLLGLAIVLPFLVFLFRVSNSSGNDKSDKKSVTWVSFEDGINLSAKEKKLFVIDFYTDWCQWCKVMDKETYGNKKIVDYSKDRAVFAKINAETPKKFKFRGAEYSGRELSMMFGVSGFPTTAFMNAEGELLTTISGFIPPERFHIILKYLAEDWHQKMKFDEFEKKENSNSKS